MITNYMLTIQSHILRGHTSKTIALKSSLLIIALVFATSIFAPKPAFAGDAATLIFTSGQKVYIGNGYKQIVEAMSATSSKNSERSVVKLDIEGGSFMLNVAEVVIACRDRCQSLEVEDMRDPKRGGRGSLGPSGLRAE